MAVKARQPDRFALAGDAEITDPVTGRVLLLGDVVREPLTGGVHTLANRQVIAADIIADKMRSGVKPAVKVALASGRWSTATGQHPLLTPDGWRPIAEIEPGETIALAGRIPWPLLPVPLPAAEIDLLAVLLAEGLPSKSTWLAKGHRTGVPQRYAPGCKPLLLARQLLNRHGMGHESAHAKKIPPRIFQVPDQPACPVPRRLLDVRRLR
jgi:intein/homing endonuclease